MMKKKQSIAVLVIAVLVTVLLGWTTIVGWGPTGTGAMKNINLGLDLSGGVSITYQAVDENPSAEDMSDTRYKLEQRAYQYSTEAQVYQQETTGSPSIFQVRPMPMISFRNWDSREVCTLSPRRMRMETRTTPMMPPSGIMC